MLTGNEDVVEAITLAAAAEPAVLGGVRMQKPVGVGQPCASEGAVELVFPVAENRMMRDVTGFHDIQVTSDDDWTVGPSEEAR